MRKPSSRWILSTLALVGVAACTVVACGDDDTTDGSGSSSGSSGTDGGGKDGSSSGAADGSNSSSGNVSDTGAPKDGDTTDTGTSSSGDSGNDSGSGDSGSDADASMDAGPDADASTPDADASKADADAATCSASGGNGGTCDIQDGIYTLHFTSGAGTPACPLPADQQTPINHCQGSNEDAGANCQVTYDFVTCKQTLHCVQTASGGGFTITTTIDNVTTWTSTKITGTSHSVSTGGPIGVDCTYQYTLTKNP